jgi:Sema domain
VGQGVAKCPFDPNDNSTAVWVEEGNPGDLPALYSGTNAEFTKADTVIFRTDLFNLTTGRRLYTYKRTLKYDSKWLDSQYQYPRSFYTPLFAFNNYCTWFSIQALFDCVRSF